MYNSSHFAQHLKLTQHGKSATLQDRKAWRLQCMGSQTAGHDWAIDRQQDVLCCVVTQSCPALCNPVDGSHQAPLSMGTLQARVLEWASIFLLQGIFPTPGIKPRSPASQADSLPFELPGKPNKCRRIGKSRWKTKRDDGTGLRTRPREQTRGGLEVAGAEQEG